MRGIWRSLRRPKKFLPKLSSIFLILYVAITLPSLTSAITSLVFLIQSVSLHGEGKLDDTNSALRQAIKPHILDGIVYYALGETLKEQGKLDEAIAAYRQAIKLFPDSYSTYGELAKALKEQGKQDEAIVVYRQYIKVHPNYAQAYNHLGYALSERGKLDEAIAAYRQAIKLDPNYDVAYNNIGNALYNQSKLNEAITAYRQAIKLDPKFAWAYDNLGNALRQQGKVDEAIAAYRQAIKLDPNYAVAYDNLGYLLTQQNKLEEAIAVYQKVFELEPDQKNIFNPYFYLGNALYNQAKFDQAIAAYRQAIKLTPKFAWAYANLGTALAERGKLDEAIAAYRQAINLVPNYASAYSELGNALQQQGKLKDAIGQFNLAMGLDPNNSNSPKFYLKEAQRLFAFQQNPQLSVMPEHLPSAKAEPLVSLKRSVVRIVITSPSDWGTGTGWVVKRQGSKAWIVTNRHVAAKGKDTPPKHQKIEVEFYSEPLPGRFRKRQPAQLAKITPADNQLDLALLEVTDIPKDIQPLPLSPTAVSLHAPIRTIGHPNTTGDWTVATGEVSYKHNNELQLSAISAPGNSGAPVLNQQNQVVGIVWGRYSQRGDKSGSTLAFPMQSVKEQLLRWGIR